MKVRRKYEVNEGEVVDEESSVFPRKWDYAFGPSGPPKLFSFQLPSTRRSSVLETTDVVDGPFAASFIRTLDVSLTTHILF